jgi:hypothetical protein
MADKLVTIALSDDLYRQALRLATESAQPLETVLVKRLEMVLDDLAGLSPDEQAELAAMQHLSDDALWSMARERFPQAVDLRQQVLGERNSRGSITTDEQAELAQLVERGNRLLVRKAEAMAILTRRGWQVTTNELMG